MELPLIRKVVVYCVHERQLLVFRHLDYPIEQTGLQVPAGSLEAGEDPATGALRELCEETGHTTYRIVRSLGTALYDIRPLRPELHERHFFQAAITAPLPARWQSAEVDHPGLAPVRFECFWIPLEHGHVLANGFGALLGQIEA